MRNIKGKKWKLIFNTPHIYVISDFPFYPPSFWSNLFYLILRSSFVLFVLGKPYSCLKFIYCFWFPSGWLYFFVNCHSGERVTAQNFSLDEISAVWKRVYFFFRPYYVSYDMGDFFQAVKIWKDISYIFMD